jgi:solute:Na+ symporter, SSS family
VDIKNAFQTTDIVVVILYIISLLAIGFYTSFRKRSSEDLFLADRSLSWYTIGFSIFGTNVSPSMMIAACSVAYTTGIVSANFEWYACILLFVLAMIFVPHYLNTKISTMPEFLERRFSPACRHFLSYYSLLTILVLWLGGALYSGGLLLMQFTGWDLWVCLTVLMIVSSCFTVTGGLTAVAYTDNFNSILMIGASMALAIIAFIKVGGVGSLINSVPPHYWHLFRPANDSAFPWHAIVLGYPVLGIWFWCTDQTIVQRVLGAKNVNHGQTGVIFTGFLKILIPFIFFFPGIFCFVLFPNLKNPDFAYMTLVTNLLPAGGVGLMVAVLMAALVSTIDGALNSFSTVFTLDIYKKSFRANAKPKEIRLIGQIMTIVIGIISVFVALSMESVGRDLFNLLQGIIAFFAPPMSSVFIVGVLWRRATSKAALTTLIIGSAVSLTIGVCQLKNIPYAGFWPHYMLLSFYLFAALVILVIVVSLFTKEKEGKEPLPTLKETYKGMHGMKLTWVLWGILASITIFLYIVFN